MAAVCASFRQRLARRSAAPGSFTASESAEQPDVRVTLEQAVERLVRGELLAFPTETVYGLGARADDDVAVGRIFAAKGRPADHPLIVHVASQDAAAHFAVGIPDEACRLMAAFWPGPLTLVLPRRPGLAAAAAGGQDSIGLRWPAHPRAQALLSAAAQRGVAGVAGPSANRFGRVSPTCADHVLAEFGPDMAVLDGGDCEVGIESTIIDCTRAVPALLRPGQLAADRIAAVLGRSLAAPDAASPRASGTLAAHYAPAVPVRLFEADQLAAAVQQRQARAARGEGQDPPRVAVYSPQVDAPWLSGGPAVSGGVLVKAMPAQADEAAHALFAALRELEASGVQAIWVQQPPAGTAWDGVRDRLRRAAAA